MSFEEPKILKTNLPLDQAEKKLIETHPFFDRNNLFVLNDENMRGYQSLFDEFIGALDFPDYFGRNLNAFDECLSDLSWLNRHQYFIFINNTQEMLSELDENAFSAILRLFASISKEWGTPVNPGEE